MQITKLATAALKNDGKIDAGEAAVIAKQVKTDADKRELRTVMELDNFDSSARKDLQKVLGGKAEPKAGAYVGTTFGVNMKGDYVSISREVGAKNGYDEKEQAMAAARMANVEPAAVIKGHDGRWHAVELTADFNDGLKWQTDNSFVRDFQALAPASKIDELRKSGGDRETLAKAIFGTDAVELTRNSLSRKSGQINVNYGWENERGAPRGLHGPENYRNEDFEPGKKSAIEINVKELKDTKGAMGVLFHETTHKNDYALADKWASEYAKTHTWVSGPAGAKPFHTWLDKQVAAKKLTPAQAELVKDVALNVNSTTEARAFTKAALAGVQSGAPEVAIDQLKTYASALKSGTYSAPANGSEVQKELTRELQQAYKSMPEDQRKALRDAVEAAKAVNPNAWVSQLVFK